MMSMCRVLTRSNLVPRLTATPLEGVSTIESVCVAFDSINCERQLCDGYAEQCSDGNHGVCLFKSDVGKM